MHCLSQQNADLFVPDASPLPNALSRTTHLGIGAHQDDLEFMALHGILECYQDTHHWFGGIICTDGGGSARCGPYANHSDHEMKAVRIKEQRNAAELGQYSYIAQLGHSSHSVKDAEERQILVKDLASLLKETEPEIVYLHNPADKHPTHVAVFLASLAALRTLPQNKRPRQVLGCEVWRSLDWLVDEDKIVLPVGAHPELTQSLFNAFQSQIIGGKRYDKAVLGRHLANATFWNSHAIDQAAQVSYAIDLTPLIENDQLNPSSYIETYIRRFTESITTRLP